MVHPPRPPPIPFLKAKLSTRRVSITAARLRGSDGCLTLFNICKVVMNARGVKASHFSICRGCGSLSLSLRTHPISIYPRPPLLGHHLSFEIWWRGLRRDGGGGGEGRRHQESVILEKISHLQMKHMLEHTNMQMRGRLGRYGHASMWAHVSVEVDFQSIICHVFFLFFYLKVRQGSFKVA